MKNLIFSLGIIICITLIITSCEKQDDLFEEQPENPALNPDGATVRICHLIGNSYSIIEISDDAWPGHEAHGDILYVEFPEVGVFKWTYDFGDGSTELHTMYITEVGESTFSGYGINNTDDREWTLVDGTIYEDDSFSFTIDYDNSDDSMECEGAYICGEGITGDFGINGSGTLAGFFAGMFSDEDGLIEINP